MTKKISPAVLWLRANDPDYVSPQKKSSKNKATPMSQEMLGEVLAGSVTRKINGVWKSVSPVALAGDAESGSLTYEPVDNTPLADTANKMRHNRGGKKRRGKRGGRGR